MWVGTRNHGLCRVSGSRFSCWTTKDGLADDFVRSLYEDDEHNLWVGLSSGGLARWRIATLIPLRDEPRELREAQPAAILEDHNGDLWIGTWGNGLFRLKQGRFLRELPPGNSPAIRTLEEDAAGNVWIGTWFNGLFRYNGAGFQQILLGRETLTDAVSALLSDKHGGFWVGTYTGLLHYADGVPAKNKGVLLLKDKLITCLAQSDDGSILVGTSAGLYRVRGRQGPHGGRAFSSLRVVHLHRQRQECVGGHQRRRTRLAQGRPSCSPGHDERHGGLHHFLRAR